MITMDGSTITMPGDEVKFEKVVPTSGGRKR